MEDPNTTTGRLLRHLIRDAGMLGGVAAEIAVSRDAELLEACAAFDALERAYLATFTGYGNNTPDEAAANAEQGRIQNAQLPLVDRICELRAVTREGHAARARSYALWDAEMMKPQDDIEGLFTQAIVRDLVG